MRPHPSLAVALVLTLLVAMLVPVAAIACTPIRGAEVVPQGGTIPPNASAIWIGTSCGAVQSEQVALTDSLGSAVPFDLADTGLLRPRTPFAAGGTFTVRVAQLWAGCRGAESTFHTAASPAAVPTRLGVLRVLGTREGLVPVPTDQGSCTIDEPAGIVDVELDLDPAFEPWRRLARLRWVLSGGEALLLEKSADANTDSPPQVSAALTCADSDTAGDRTLMAVVDLVGTDVHLESSPISFSLACPSAFAGCGCAAADPANVFAAMAIVRYAARRRSRGHGAV